METQGTSRGDQLYQTETATRQDYAREDTRWENANTTRDWLILVLVIALHTTWMLFVFFMEPGIR